MCHMSQDEVERPQQLDSTSDRMTGMEITDESTLSATFFVLQNMAAEDTGARGSKLKARCYDEEVGTNCIQIDRAAIVHTKRKKDVIQSAPWAAQTSGCDSNHNHNLLKHYSCDEGAYLFSDHAFQLYNLCSN